MLHPNPRKPSCPYCYDGELFRDKHTGLLFCPRCTYAVEVKDY